jgi:outer membrane protein TolC
MFLPKGRLKKIPLNLYVNKSKLMMRYLILITVLFSGLSLPAQNGKVLKLTLQDVIELASRQSLDAFRQQNMYRASYWGYKYYLADRRPFLSFGSNPLSYKNIFSPYYDADKQKWGSNKQNSITSFGAMSLSQNIGLTGGTLNLSSDLNVSKNFIPDPETGQKVTTFTSDPFVIGYTQRINGYNSFRWKSRIEPLKFEKAKKELIQSMEDIAVKATGKFFSMIDAQIELKIATTNLANADTLYQLGKGRYQVGTVTQDELLNMELTLMNAKLAVTKANQSLVRTRSDLNSFLAQEKGTTIECILPSKVSSTLQIDVDEAIQKSFINNPDILAQKQRLLESDQNVAQTKAENGLSVYLNASAGLNQKANLLDQAYQNPSKSQNLTIASLTVPILDWGKRKGAVLMAKSNREVVRNTINQERIDFEQSVLMNVMEFNLQSDQVLSSAKADTIAQMGFDVTMRRFKIGKLDITKLNLARNDVETARRAYISSLRKYWTNYYTIRQLTLYDFDKKEDLTVNFDKIPTE